LAAVPFIAALALYQWKTFGSPFTTGYDHWLPRAREFDLSFVSSKGVFGQPIRDKLNGALLNWLVCPCDRSPGIPGGSSVSALPNYAFYPAALAGIFWVYAPPFTALIGAVQLWRERMTPAARYSIVTIVLSVVLLLFYFYQAERFLAPTASLLLIYTAAGASSLLSAAWRWLHRRRPATSTPTPITQPT
jgi:hypothetical protein